MSDVFQISEEDLQSSRQTVINWPLQVQTISDGYRSNGKGIPHGVQKDAIQNSWDARKDRRKALGWSTKFELIENNKINFLLVEDYGTYGLTGRILKHEELEEDLPSEERWGRFENLAFTKSPSEEALGSRGRGKFIFVGASKNLTILYDTLRDDGIYRFGFRTIKSTESPINAFNDDDGRQKLCEYTSNILKPLNRVGTRIIIVNPIDELIEDIRSKKFIRYIEETWWEIIDKYNADIRVINNGDESKAKIPKEFLLNIEETKDRKVWHKPPYQEISIGSNKYRIKEFYAVCDKNNPVPEDIRGIAIQRGGMKICGMPMDYPTKEIGRSLFGFISLDNDFDKVILADENVEHYSFDYRKQATGRLKRYIQDELTEFGRKKLGLGVDPRKVEKERRTNAERRALAVINHIASHLGISKFGIGHNKSKTQTLPSSPLPIKLEMSYLEFPTGINRINYGEEIGNINLQCISRKEQRIQTKIQLFIKFDDEKVKELFNQDFLIIKGKQQIYGPGKEKIDPITYSRPGKYTLRARLISLEKNDKGTLLDEISRHFYVEQDPPPLSGVFEDCKNADFPEDAAELMSYPEIGSRKGSYILIYNKNHPAKKAVDQDEDSLTDYIVHLMALSLPWIDLRENTNKLKLFKKPASGKLDNEQIAKQFPDILSNILFLYYKKKWQ